MNTMAPIVLGCKVGQISFLGITNLLSNPYKAKQILSRETKSLDIVLLDSIGLPVLAHVPLPPPYARADPGGGGEPGGPDPPPWNFGKKVVIRFVIGTGLILYSIYVNYSHKSKKGSKCGDLMVRT